jgi:hypothetical protein
MQLTRAYYNYSEDLLRIDDCFLQLEQTYEHVVKYTGNHASYRAKRVVRTENYHDGAVGDRQIMKVVVTGDYDSLDTTDFEWARWNRGDGHYWAMDMSDLPAAGDTI